MTYMCSNYVNRMEMIGYQPSIIRRKKHCINPMDVLDETEFKKKYRFSKSNMTKVIQIVKNELYGDIRGVYIPAELQIMAAIRYWGRNEVKDYCDDIHGFSQPEMSIITERVAKAFASKSSAFIRMPRTESEQIRVMEKFKSIRGVPFVIGAIDCTHIKVKREGVLDTGLYHLNSKGYFSINVQAVCDADLKITDIFCNWRDNYGIFDKCSLKARLDRGDFRGRLLGDIGYEYSNRLFTPVLNPTTQEKTNYYTAHIATRNTIKRTFGVWKSRFRILQTGMRCSLQNAETLIVALAVLHNLAIEFNDELDLNNNKGAARRGQKFHQFLILFVYVSTVFFSIIAMFCLYSNSKRF